MSQFDTTPVDPFLLYMENEHFSHPPSSYDHDNANGSVSSSTDPLTALDFTYIDTDNPHFSAASTPNFPCEFDFNNNYPTPSQSPPNPYPLDTPCLLSDSPAYPFPATNPSTTRRRSLSTSDAGRLPVPNPTFIRLQAPRGRPLAPDNERLRRSSPYPSHARSASHTHSRNGANTSGSGSSTSRNTRNTTSSPWDMLPTPIGTPIGSPRYTNTNPTPRHCHPQPQSHTPRLNPTHPHTSQLSIQPLPPRLLPQSQRIIQLGAMEVKRPTLLHSRSHPGPGDGQTLLRSLADIETHLIRAGTTEDVLGACGVLRSALSAPGTGRSVKGGQGEKEVNRVDDEGEHGDMDGVNKEVSEVVDAVGATPECSVDESLMALLMQESECFES